MISIRLNGNVKCLADDVRDDVPRPNGIKVAGLACASFNFPGIKSSSTKTNSNIKPPKRLSLRLSHTLYNRDRSGLLG